MAEQAVGQAQARVIEGNLVVPPGSRFALVASRFNHFIVDRLVEGALDAIARHGGALGRTSIVRVPGAWEMPTVVGRLAHKKGVDAIITLGAVIRGSTPHFDYVAAEVTKGIATVSLQTGVPVTFGVLTTDSIEQAMERSVESLSENKGHDTALTAVEMAQLLRSIG
jgi:6,7-dimethyl-8-ribityllumazine synthase